MKRSKIILSGIVMMMKGSLAFSLMALCVKFASQTLPSLEIVFFRSLFGVLIIAALIKKKKVAFWGTEKKLLIFRGISGFLALTLHFYTLSNLPLGIAMILNYTSPIFAALLAIFFLKERPGILVLSMIGLAFTGIYLLTGIGEYAWSKIVFIGLLSAIFAAIAYVFIRAIKHRESPLTIIFYFTFISTLGSAFYLPFGFIWPSPIEWLALIGVGAGSFFGQLWMTIALRRAPASIITPFSYLAPVLTFMYGFLFFGEAMTVTALAGAGLIILAGSFISIFGTKKSKTR